MRRKAKFEDEADAIMAEQLAAMAEAEERASERVPVLLRLPRGVLEFFDRLAADTGMSRNEVVTQALTYLMVNLEESGDLTLGSPIGRFHRRVNSMVSKMMREIAEKAASVQLLEELAKRRALRHERSVDDEPGR